MPSDLDKPDDFSPEPTGEDARHSEGAQFEPIRDPDDLLGEAMRRMNERQRESIISKAADEALRLGAKQSEGAIDRGMEMAAVNAVAEAASRLHGDATDYEVRTVHRSQHGSVYVTVRNAPPPLIARISPRASSLPRWVPLGLVVLVAAIILTTVGIRTLSGHAETAPRQVGVSSVAVYGRAASATKYIDGDTLAVAGVDGGATEEKIRLLAIDTPERGQLWYAEAGSALREIVSGRPIHLEYETPGKLERDKYGRVLAYLIVDGQNVNVEMVRLGWTAYVTKYGGDRYAKEFTAAEEEARAAHRGIWSSR